MILYRPVGTKELNLIRESGYRAFPPKLPEQPVFYTILYLQHILLFVVIQSVKYNDDHKGYVTKFEVDDSYGTQFEVHCVGDSYHEELWVPADELEEFNRHIIGEIKVIREFSDD